jgi:hypothetical protein
MIARRQAAREARLIVELALDAAGWPWSLRLSRWIDALLILEEDGA